MPLKFRSWGSGSKAGTNENSAACTTHGTQKEISRQEKHEAQDDTLSQSGTASCSNGTQTSEEEAQEMRYLVTRDGRKIAPLHPTDNTKRWNVPRLVFDAILRRPIRLTRR